MGCANSLLLLALHRAGLLQKGQIVVYEPEQKVQNDRTFCFWLEPHALQNAGLDTLVSHSWSHAKCTTTVAQELAGKRYYYIRSEALYSKARELLVHYEANWIAQEFEQTHSELAKFVFDSRPPTFETSALPYTSLTQSFYGWLVQTEKSIFDPSVFTMMDFSIPQNGYTQFLYVLPFDANTALIEPTRFGTEPMTEVEATQHIKAFLDLHDTSYQIKEKEQGSIPMCGAALREEALPPNWFRTGAGGGQLKPSTGYSFVRSLTDAQQICSSIAQKAQKVSRRPALARFAYYDRLLLQILSRTPQRGKMIFERLFAKNDAARVLDFLDERTHPAKELKIMLSLPIGWFVWAALCDFFWMLQTNLKKIAPALVVALLCLCLQTIGQLVWTWPLFAIGILGVGLPHGALDHLHVIPGKNWRQLFPYVLWYLGMGAAVLVLWLLAPKLALLFFLAYSAWHFGQADLQIWKRNQAIWQPFLWGSFLLLFLLSTHFSEVQKVLHEMGIELYWRSNELFMTYFKSFQTWMMLGIIPILIFRSWRVAEAVLVLTLLSQIPLLEAFATFFIFQHSLNGWRHLTATLPYDSKTLWLQALPFTLGSIGLFTAYLYGAAAHNWGLVFIFLSALSFPHVYFMHRAYRS